MINGAFIIALFVLGVHYVLDSLLYGKIEEIGLVNKWYMKPLMLCHLCMTSVWGTVGYFLAYDLERVEHFLLTLFIASTFNVLIYGLIERINR